MWTADFLILIITNFHFMTQYYAELQIWYSFTVLLPLLVVVVVVVVAVVVYHTEALYTHLSPVTTTSCYRAKLQETIKIHSPTYMLNLFQSTACLTFKQKPRNMAIFIRYKFLNRLAVHIILQKSTCQNHVQCPVWSARAFCELLFLGTFRLSRSLHVWITFLCTVRSHSIDLILLQLAF